MAAVQGLANAFKAFQTTYSENTSAPTSLKRPPTWLCANDINNVSNSETPRTWLPRIETRGDASPDSLDSNRVAPNCRNPDCPKYYASLNSFSGPKVWQKCPCCTQVAVDVEEHPESYSLWLDVPGLQKSDVIVGSPSSTLITLSSHVSGRLSLQPSNACGLCIPVTDAYLPCSGSLSQDLLATISLCWRIIPGGSGWEIVEA